MEGRVCSAPHSPTTVPLLLAGPMCTGRGAIRVWDDTSRPFPPQGSGEGGWVRKWRPGGQVTRPWWWGRRRRLMAAGFHGDRGGGRGGGCRDVRGSAGGERWRRGWRRRGGGADPVPWRQEAPRRHQGVCGSPVGHPCFRTATGCAGEEEEEEEGVEMALSAAPVLWRSGLVAC